MAGDAHGATLSDYLRVLRRRKWLIGQAVLLVPAAAVALSLQQTKLYRASAQVLLVQQNIANQLNGITDPGVYQQADRRAQTQADLARVPAVVERATRLAGSRMSTTKFLASSSASAKTNADLLQLSVTNHDPQLAKRLATAYANAFAAYRSDLDTAPYLKARERADGQLEEMRATGLKDSGAYQDLLNKRDQLDQMIALLTQNAVPVQNADSASQVQPRPVRNGILGLALGIVLGIGLAFAREALDTRVRTSDEIAEALGVPLLGRVPPPARKNRRADKLTMLFEPDGAHAETFRMLRTNLDFVRLSSDARALVVTSCVEQEGKSTTAANLAITLALAGQRVALVDLDLRRPYLDKFFDLGNRPGITEVALGHASLGRAIAPFVISGKAEWRRAVLADHSNGNGTHDADANLTIIPSGPLPPNPGDFVGSAALDRVLAELRQCFTTVIIDSPPALQVGDAMTLSRRADALIVVTRMNVVRKPMLTELHRLLDASPAEKLGFIVTGTEAGDSYYGSGYYYGRADAPAREQREEAGVL